MGSTPIGRATFTKKIKMSTNKRWADTSTLKGQIEAAIEPIISGGVGEPEIEKAVNGIMEIIGEREWESSFISSLHTD